jgi:hypothetical protein
MKELPKENSKPFDKVFQKWQLIFVQKLTKLERNATRKQKVRGLLIFSLIMITIYGLSIWQQLSETHNSSAFQPQNIVIPLDVALPDSLDIQQHQFNKKWNHQQLDSNSKTR